ncbi:hypothetical protein IQ07DRAFT_522415, partial [Pyrenochaeta sp. DS3sAY3a]
STALDAWLGAESITSGLISDKKTLSIKADTLPPVTQVEEIKDSEDDNKDNIAPTLS